MIMCTLLAGGGVFWAAGEPVWHLLNPPPYFDAIGVNDAASIGVTVIFALGVFSIHFGALSTILLCIIIMRKVLPLAPRTLLYPVFGQYALEGILGVVIDASAIICGGCWNCGSHWFFGFASGLWLGVIVGLDKYD